MPTSLILSDRGRLYWLKVHAIPDVGPDGRGKSIANLVSMEPEEKIAALLAVRAWPAEDGERYIVTGTRRGAVKKTDLRSFRHPRQAGVIAVGVTDNDAVIAAEITDGQGEIFLGTRGGKAIRFAERDVRPMGRTAPRGARNPAASWGRGGRHGGRAAWRRRADGDGARLREAHRT